MTLAFWHSFTRRQRRLTGPAARAGCRARTFNLKVSFEALEDRRLLSTVSFGTAGESVDGDSGAFAVPVTLTGPPSATPTTVSFGGGFNTPLALAFNAGDLYVANAHANTVSEVSSNGVVITTDQGFNFPSGLAFDSSGNLYVANSGNNNVSKITPEGVVTTFAQGFDVPQGLAFDSNGNLYVSNEHNGTITEVTPTGKSIPFASGLLGPIALAFNAGNLYVACLFSGTVNEVSSSGVVNPTPFAQGLDEPDGLAFDPSGNLYVANSSGGDVIKVTPAGVETTFVSGFHTAAGLAFDAGGNLYVSDAAEGTVTKVSDPVIVPFTLGGTATPGAAYTGITGSPLVFGIGQTSQSITGTLLFDPGPNQSLTLSLDAPTGGASLGAPSFTTLTINEPAKVQFSTGSETINESAGTFSIPVTISGTPIVSTLQSGFDDPFGLAVDADGYLYVANTDDNTVSKVTSEGIVTTFVSSGLSAPFGLAFDTAGNLYIANAGNNTVSVVSPAGVVTSTIHGFSGPAGLAFDSAGNLYVANSTAGTVSMVSPMGVVSTFASGFVEPYGVAVDSAGNVYVADADDESVSKVTPTGKVSTFASGLAGPDGLAFDAAGNLYVSDGNGTLGEVTPAGVVSTLAYGFNQPAGLAFYGGDLYVTDSGNNTLNELFQSVNVPFMLGGSAAAGVAFSGVADGLLTFTIGQTTQDITGRLLSDPGPAQTLTFTLGTPTGGGVVGSPSQNTLTITESATGTPTPTPTPAGTAVAPVFLGEQRVFSGKGQHKRLRAFEFIFNGALNAGSAQSTANYHVTQKKGRKLKVLRVKSAVENSSNTSVTITVGSFQTGKAAQAVITGLTGADGAAISPITTGL